MRRADGFRAMALAGVCARDSVAADVPGSARGRGVVGASDQSWRRPRRVQALASLGRDDTHDPRRQQTVVIAYTLARHRAVSDRLGVFVTAVRASLNGRWRLLEASVAP